MNANRRPGRALRLIAVIAGIVYLAALVLVPFWSVAIWIVLVPLAAVMALLVLSALVQAFEWAWRG